MLYFRNPDDFIPNMMIETSPCFPVHVVTLVSLFRSYNQFYRAECITVLGFLCSVLENKEPVPVTAKKSLRYRLVALRLMKG